MEAQTLTGGFDQPPHQSAEAFRAAMRAMAMPGTIARIAGAEGPLPLSQAASTVLLTLCDGETPLYLAKGHDTPAVREWITFHTGAPFSDAGSAMFALGTWDDLAPHSAFCVGTPEYPDRSATLIVEVAHLRPQGARLTGPGIETEAFLNVPDAAFLQANAARYPLGVDVFLTTGNRIAALPRSTKVTSCTSR